MLQRSVPLNRFGVADNCDLRAGVGDDLYGVLQLGNIPCDGHGLGDADLQACHLRLFDHVQRSIAGKTHQIPLSVVCPGHGVGGSDDLQQGNTREFALDLRASGGQLPHGNAEVPAHRGGNFLCRRSVKAVPPLILRQIPAAIHGGDIAQDALTVCGNRMEYACIDRLAIYLHGDLAALVQIRQICWISFIKRQSRAPFPGHLGDISLPGDIPDQLGNIPDAAAARSGEKHTVVSIHS